MHTTKQIRTSLLVLLGIAVAASRAEAQPMHTTSWTLEARIAEADRVFVGPIAKVSRKEIVPPGGRSKEGILQPNGIFQCTLTVKVDETLKGKIKDKLVDLRPIGELFFRKEYDDSANTQASRLWFLGPAPAQPDDAHGWRFLDEPSIYSMDLTRLKDMKEILTRARAYAKTSTKVLPIHPLRLPPGRLHDYMVPVEPALEQTAKRLIASPQDFVAKGSKLDAFTRYQLRFSGVDALSYFRSDANIALLRPLLDGPLEEIKGGFGKPYPIPTKAYEVLLAWGVDVPLPKSADQITTIDLASTQVTDTALKQLAGLKNLAKVDLSFTQVTDKGLRELAGVKKLRSLSLSETQLTDANVRVLREIGLLHTLRQASGKGEGRPKSADDVVMLEWWRAPLTDAGLKELAGFKNLTALYLNDSRVTGTGFKELAGLEKITTLHLHHAPVTDAGLKDVARLKNLTTLMLGQTKITDAGLRELAGLTHLKVLNLQGTNVSAAGLKELAGLKNLVVLNLNGNQVTDATLETLRALGMLHTFSSDTGLQQQHAKSDTALTTIGLDGPHVSDAGLKELAGLGSLQQLSLGGTKVTGTGFKELAGLKNLTEIFVHDTPLTEAGLRELAFLKSLRTLHLCGKEVTDARLRALAQTGMVHVLYDAGATANYPPATFPPRAQSDDAVRSLDLGGWHSVEGTVVTDASLKEIARLKNLVKLNLTHTPVTGSGLKDLAGLKKLTRLSLGGPQVIDAGLRDLPSLENLTTLGLHDTKLTSAGMKHVLGLKKLTTLNLSGKAVTDAWLKELTGLENLTQLKLLWTSVTDAGVAEFQKSRPNCKIER